MQQQDAPSARARAPAPRPSPTADGHAERATRRALVAVLLVVAALLTACVPRRSPVLEPLRAVATRTPVVLIPGITGTRLADPQSGRVVWGNTRSVFLPRDGGDRLALPIDPASPRSAGLVTAGPVTVFRIGPLRFEFYAALIRLMEANGYRHGDLADPAPGEDFFIFGYDWRRGNLVAVRELERALERLRQARGEDVLHVNLICQSNAARIARYFVKYGAAPLERAEDGTARPPEQIRVDKVILVGTDNGGALGTLLDLNRGRRYLPLLGRRFRPEALFSLPSLYEGLPARGRDLFVDGEGRTVDIDLYDPEDWRRYEWSIYAPAAQRRLRRRPRPELYGDAAKRAAFLARALSDAQRLHRVLERDAPSFAAASYYLVQNVYDKTDRRAVVVLERGRWRTLFVADRRVRKDPYLLTRTAAPGDGHATLESQMALSPQEIEALANPPVYVDAPHRRVVLSPAAHRWILQFLLE